MDVVLGILLLGGFVVLVLWLLGQPEDEEVDEELAGFVAANWRRFRE